MSSEMPSSSASSTASRNSPLSMTESGSQTSNVRCFHISATLFDSSTAISYSSVLAFTSFSNFFAFTFHEDSSSCISLTFNTIGSGFFSVKLSISSRNFSFSTSTSAVAAATLLFKAPVLADMMYSLSNSNIFFFIC